MKNIIDMVLDVRKLEEGKDMLHILPYSLNEWVRSVGDKFADEYRVKGIWLEYELDERIGKVPFDKNKCEFVLSNFLMNALKFSESNTTTTLITCLLEGEGRVRVSIKGYMRREGVVSDFLMRRALLLIIREKWVLRIQKEKGRYSILSYRYWRIHMDDRNCCGQIRLQEWK